MYKNTAQPTVAGLHQGTTMQPATSGTRDNRADPPESSRHRVPGSAVSVLRSWHAFPPLALFTSLNRRAVGPAGDTSSEFLHPRSRRQEVLREPGRSTDPAVTSW